MSPIITTTDVDGTTGDVFAYATDASRFKEWQEGVVDGHLETPDAVQVGTRCMTTRRIVWCSAGTSARSGRWRPTRS